MMAKVNLTRTLAGFGYLGLISLTTIQLSGCGPKAFTKGAYDDPTRVELLDDKWNEADMQQMSDAIVEAMVKCDEIIKASKPPRVAVEQVLNRTEEHIDMRSMTDKIRTALIKSKRVKFINKEERSTLEDEYVYNEGGNVAQETKKKRGKQTGLDYIMSGALATNIQQVGNDKFIYYKLTMNLTNVETSEIDCVEDKEIRKQFRKRRVGL